MQPHSKNNNKNYDVLIIGSGGAGLSLALKLADHATHVAVLSKFALTAGSTYYAQGGISAVFDADDSIESHIEDTLDAGAGCRRNHLPAFAQSV